MRKIFYLTIAVVLLVSGNEAFAQMNRKAVKKNNRRIATFRGKKAWFSKEKRYNAIGISVSALNYFGDLSPKPGKLSTDISFTRPAIAFSFTHRFGPRYSVTGSFMYGALRGADSESANAGDAGNGFYRSVRNLSFRNRIKELSVVATIDLFENQSTYISRVKWTPYAFLGVALFYNNPQAQVPAYHVDGITKFDNAGQWVDLQPLGTEGQGHTLAPGDANYGIKPYHKIQAAIPFGIGARFRLNEVFDVAAEIGFRYTFTDYLDDVSKSYVDLGVFGDNELAKAMSYRSGELPEYNPSVLANRNDNVPIPGPLQNYPGRDNPPGGYWVYPGFGSEYNDAGTNKRGSATNNKDYYMVTTIRLTYILGKTFHRAKFR